MIPINPEQSEDGNDSDLSPCHGVLTAFLCIFIEYKRFRIPTANKKTSQLAPRGLLFLKLVSDLFH
jgi:hypothetical protein